MKKQPNTDEIYTLFIKAPVKSEEYKKCIDLLRLNETGGHTLGMNLALEPVRATREIVEYNISEVL